MSIPNVCVPQDLVLLTNNTTKRIINLSERIDKLIENLPEIEINMMKQSVIKLSDRKILYTPKYLNQKIKKE